ncbi:hypothetical protein FRAHR75_40169 [Frankia sp. Hr75.2]|nr:hypothetical protein FRAHR75_40169 [Frankia sp. Hr75.2]
MDRAGVGSLLMVDEERLAGIVTDRDLALRVVAPAVPLDDLLAAAADPRTAALGAVAAEEIGHPHHEGGLPLPLDALRPRLRVLSRWQARVGDAVVVRAAVGNGAKRDGEILEVATPAGDPPSWSAGPTAG